MGSMNSKYDVTIVIISYNTVSMTRECIQSVFKNLGQISAQVIVVDNNSQDGSTEMVENDFPEVTLIKNDNNRGFAAANNQGFEIAKGEMVLLLNSDTIILGRVIENSITYLKNHPEVGAMGCRVLNTDRTTQLTCSGFPTFSRLLCFTLGLDRLSGIFDHYLLRRWHRDDERDVDVISGCYLMTRASIIKQVGPLDEDFFFFGEETDWCLRMREAGWKLRFSPIGEIIHHGGGSVKKLNHKRDVMLTDATIRLQRKHQGIFAARATYCLLLVFNCTRALYWLIKGCFSYKSYLRGKHFIKVVCSMSDSWRRE